MSWRLLADIGIGSVFRSRMGQVEFGGKFLGRGFAPQDLEHPPCGAGEHVDGRGPRFGHRTARVPPVVADGQPAAARAIPSRIHLVANG
jgi:hypothetical protein